MRHGPHHSAQKSTSTGTSDSTTSPWKLVDVISRAGMAGKFLLGARERYTAWRSERNERVFHINRRWDCLLHSRSGRCRIARVRAAEAVDVGDRAPRGIETLAHGIRRVALDRQQAGAAHRDHDADVAVPEVDDVAGPRLGEG